MKLQISSRRLFQTLQILEVLILVRTVDFKTAEARARQLEHRDADEV